MEGPQERWGAWQGAPAGGGRADRAGEEGFLLLGLVVAIFLILLLLGVAAPRVAKALRRDKEVESQHRAEQYVRGIQLYYRKFGHYPGSIDQLEKSNNVRFLRQKYVDPLTGKPDWKLISVGQAKTTVKGFFGQPLAGIASTGLGSAAGLASPGGTGTVAGASGSAGSAFGGSSSGSAFGSSSGSAFGSGTGSGSGSGSGTGSAFNNSSSSGSGFGSSSSGLGGGGLGGSTSSTGGGSPGGGSSTTGSGSGFGSSSSSGIGSQSATSFTGGSAPFLGVGSSATGDSIVVVNEQTTYPTWEFLYDPRVEAMKAKVSLFGGGPASVSATGLGTASSLSSGIGGAGAAGGLGSGTGTGVGSATGTGTGSATGSGGTSGSGLNPGTGTTQPQ